MVGIPWEPAQISQDIFTVQWSGKSESSSQDGHGVKFHTRKINRLLALPNVSHNALPSSKLCASKSDPQTGLSSVYRWSHDVNSNIITATLESDIPTSGLDLLLCERTKLSEKTVTGFITLHPLSVPTASI